VFFGAKTLLQKKYRFQENRAKIMKRYWKQTLTTASTVGAHAEEPSKLLFDMLL
jgi:hypothetical protein